MNRGLYGYPSAVDPIPWETKFSTQPTWRSPIGQANANNNANSGTLYCCMMKVFRPIVFDGMCVRFPTTPSASLDVHMGVYADRGVSEEVSSDSFHKPGNLIVGQVLTGITTSGVKSALHEDQYLSPGIYWVGAMQVHSTSGQQMFETRSGYELHMRQQWWMTNPNGYGATPSTLAAGNDGVAWQQSGLTALPSVFRGTIRSDANNPHGTTWMAFRVRAA